MTQHNHTRLILDLTEALRGSVTKRRHDDVLAALKRCQELIGNLSIVVLDLDTKNQHGELMLEAKLYANVLAGFFNDVDRDWLDLTKGYNPRDYLTTKGVIKAPNPTRIKMEEKFAADRKAQEDEINRIISDLEWKKAQKTLKRAKRSLVEVVTPIKPASKRGRPIGSKNKRKGIVSKVNALMASKKKAGGK